LFFCRDTSELEPVTHANEAVRRFYRLIQAARDGQEQKDCQNLYPQCNMQTKWLRVVEGSSCTEYEQFYESTIPC